MKNILMKLKRLFCLCAVSRSLLSDDEIRNALEESIKKYDVNDTAKEVWIDGAKWMRDYMAGRNDD
jgi:hypothetical protein